jgi:hypothetical protein
VHARDTDRSTESGELADVALYDDGSFPQFVFKQAPAGYATRRQLRALGLRPGGQEPAGQLVWRRGARFAWLYRIDLAKPKRTATLAQERALDRAMAARQTCPTCLRRFHACLPLKTLGSCVECHDGTPAHPSSYLPSPQASRPAA